MTLLQNLSDEDIDALLLRLFNGDRTPKATYTSSPRRIEGFSHEELLRIRSRNHPDKWPHVNQKAYQAAVEELDRRRHLEKSVICD